MNQKLALDIHDQILLGDLADLFVRACSERGLDPHKLIDSSLKSTPDSPIRKRKPDHSDSPMWSLPEVAKYLSISRRTIERWTADGLIPSVKIAKRRFIDIRDVESIIQGLKK